MFPLTSPDAESRPWTTASARVQNRTQKGSSPAISGRFSEQRAWHIMGKYAF